ncbi:MAG: PDZ domain-containing protein [Helicobacteraceae bacterium]|jgi:serine protease Do|nr:PDZ domain-containing protein [Helicobacteraceae bacterium]
MRFLFCALFAPLVVCLSAEDVDLRGRLFDSFASMLERASKNAVYIMSANDDQTGVGTPFADDPWFRPYFQYPQLELSAQKLRASLGSGAIISGDGLIVTSAKIARDRATLKVMIADRPEPLVAKVLGTDQSLDIAVLKVAVDNLPEPVFADISSIRTGDLVFSIGNPFGIEPIVSMGVISALGRQMEDDRLIQSDLRIHGGFIGGVIVNARGEIAGVPTYPFGAQSREPLGGFFLPIERVKAVAERIERSGNIKDAWLGVAVSDLTREMKSYFGRDDGVVITAVEAHSPAADVGLKKGDLLLLADNAMIANVADFERILSAVVADRDITFLFLRDRRLREAVLRVGRLEMTGRNTVSRTLYYEGATFETLTPLWRERLGMAETSLGVVTLDVDAVSLAAKSGFEAGDVIVQIDGREIDSLPQLQEAVAAGKPSSFMVMRGGVAVALTLERETTANER